MNSEQWKTLAAAQMPDKRWQHVLGVVDSAVELAERFGGDSEKAELAALLHDFCKAWPIERQRQAVRQDGRYPELLDYDKELWHAHAAAYVLQQEYGLVDQEVLDAVRWHTSGRERMTMLDKIVCLADYIEPGRDYPDVHKIRRLAEHSLEEALVAGFDSTISFLLSRGKRIYPLTVFTRNGLLQELETKTNGGGTL